MGVLFTDDGICATTTKGLAKLKPVKPNGTVTFRSQMHPSEGNASMIVATSEFAREVSADPKIEVELLGLGQAPVGREHMPTAVAPAALVALKNAGLTIKDVDAIKVKNPFAVSDIAFASKTDFPLAKMNNYSYSLIWGHPQGPTSIRSVIELFEELVLRDDSVGLLGGCVAGDSGKAVVVRVSG